MSKVKMASTADRDVGDIPLRYLRRELHSGEVLADETLQIPIIDMKKLIMADDDEMGKLHLACTEWGFFQSSGQTQVCLFNEYATKREGVQRGSEIKQKAEMVVEEMSRELVPDVQALASINSGDIPLLYLRPELQSEEVLVDETLQIPTIDMRKLVVDDHEMGKLHSACKEWGFFQLINHGVAEEVVEKMKADVQGFFKLPQKEKNAYAKSSNGVDGYGPNFVSSDGQKLDWADTFFLQTLPIPERKMRLWPLEPTSFKETLDKFSLEFEKVSKCLLKLMAKNLITNPAEFADMFEGGRQAVRMNYYPPCVEASKVMGVTPHSDFGGLTLLVQVNEVQGLQIKKNGKWIPIRPLPGAFIVNIGDVIEILSNGEYKSIEHRALVNPEKERLSIATFYSPCDGTIIGPLTELTKENGAKYKSVSREEYIKFVLTRKLDGKSSVNLMKLES